MSVLLSHPTGNANVRNALLALHEAGLLSEFVTTVASYDRTFFGTLSSLPFGKELKRRSYPQELQPITKLNPWRELIRMLAPRTGLTKLTAHETGPFSIDKVYRAIDRTAQQRLQRHTDVKAVYGYEDGCLASFTAAHAQNVRCIYEQPIGYWRAAHAIQQEEAKLRPDWAATMPALIDSQEKLARKDAELKLADTVITASSFTARTLDRAPFDLPKAQVIPYGCPEVSIDTPLESKSGSAIRALYIGSLTQRKGIAEVFEAVSTADCEIELTIVGKRVTDCAPLDRQLNEHRWIETIAHSELLHLMREHDVLLFPSIFEGFGLVLTEALSQGLPAIATEHTCAPDILTDRKDGLLVPIRRADLIAEELNRLASDRDVLNAMKYAALRTARKHTWSRYRSQLASTVQAVLENERLHSCG